MSHSSSVAGATKNPLLNPDMAGVKAYIDQLVNERLASIQGHRSPSSNTIKDEDDDDEGGSAFGIANAGDDEDSDDEPLPPLISRSPSLRGVDLELVNALGYGLNISPPTGSLSPTSSNLVPAQVEAAVRRAMASASGSASDVEAILAPGGDDTQSGPQGTGGASAPAPPPLAAPQAAALVSLPPTLPPLPTTVPAPLPLIPGLHSLAGTPAPAPPDAVFAGPNDGPFYAITRGIRIGVMGGWDVASPFVTGVSGAVFQRKPSLLAAYQAYHQAYYQHITTRYL